MIFRGLQKPKDCFGGNYLKNSHAKTRRPLSSKLPMHLVLRSELAKGRFSFLNYKQYRQVNRLVREVARKHQVTIHDYANSGNHLHILLRLRAVRDWAAFIRELTGRIAQVVQGLTAKETGAAKFWDQRPFTRIVGDWNRSFKIVRRYILRNRVEAEGLNPLKQCLDSA